MKIQHGGPVAILNMILFNISRLKPTDTSKG